MGPVGCQINNWHCTGLQAFKSALGAFTFTVHNRSLHYFILSCQAVRRLLTSVFTSETSLGRQETTTAGGEELSLTQRALVPNKTYTNLT